MIIQCPECKSRYRTKNIPAGKSSIQFKCPKCAKSFQVNTESTEPAAVSSEQATILLVDDARFFRELLIDLLKDRDVRLVTADSAKEAWQALQGNAIALMIVDINLPDKNGLELIKEIRADKKLADLAILCISGVYRKEDDAVKAIRAGADDFISKSFKPEELNERVDKLLKR